MGSSPLILSGPTKVSAIFSKVQANLYEAKLRWFSYTDIMASLQEAYNKVSAILCLNEKATLFPQLSSPYYNFGKFIPNYMYVRGIYNVFTLLWLDGISYKIMKNTYYTYLTIGDPRFFDIIDLNRVLVWPFNNTATGILFVVYAASPGTITDDTVPNLPFSVGSQVLECFATADLLEQAREFNKAAKYWERLLKPREGNQRSLLKQAELEVKALARFDQENVLEPYRWLFHGGSQNSMNWISNETPAGTIDGNNTVFTLSQVPNPSASLIFTKNGQILYQDIAFSFNGQSATFNTGYIPQTGDLVRAWYQIN